MKFLFKFTLSLILVLSLLILTAIILLTTVISPNNFKSQISQQVYKYTGRELILQGDLNWTFYPWLGLQVNNAVLNNNSQFSDESFAKIQHATVSVKLVPLLHRQIEIGKIKLDGLEIHLVKNSKGISNWQDLMSSSAADKIADAKTADTNALLSTDANTNSTAQNSGTFKDLAFKVASLDIKNSKVTLTDQKTNQEQLLEQFELHSKNITTDKSFPLNLHFVIRSSDPNIKGDVTLRGQTSLAQQIYQIKQLQLNARLTGPSLPNKEMNLNLQGEAEVNPSTQSATGQLSSDQIKIGNMTLNKVFLTFAHKNNIADINPIRAEIYGGTYSGWLKVNLQNKIPQISSQNTFTNIQAEPLLKDLSTVTKIRLTGVGNLTATVQTKGDSGDTIVKNINGQGQFSLNNGTLYGINIPYWIGTGVALLQKQPLPTISAENKTDFGNLTGTFTITNGVLQNNDLLMKSEQLAVTGSGAADLVKQQINYELRAQLVDAGGQAKGDVIPIQVTGDLTKPKIRPSIGEILKSKLKDQIVKNKEVIGQQIQKLLGKDTGSKLQNQLQSLFGR